MSVSEKEIKCLVCGGKVDSPDSPPINICTKCYWDEMSKRKLKRYVTPYRYNGNSQKWELLK